MDAASREAGLRTSFVEILDSNRAKKFTSINRGRIEQCLIRNMSPIAIDFDDACAQGQRVSKDALDEILMDYVRSCVRG